MHWLAKIVLIVAGNAFALYLAERFVPGFILNATLTQLTAIAFVLAILNFILKPVLTLLLGPLIVLTLGLGLIAVNAAILWSLTQVAERIDFLKGSITIQPDQFIPALLLATLIVSAVNFVIHLAT